MEDMSLSPDRTLIIEDSKTGLVSAVASKAKVIGITTSLSKQQINDIDPSIYTIDSYPELGEYLQNL